MSTGRPALFAVWKTPTSSLPIHAGFCFLRLRLGVDLHEERHDAPAPRGAS
ncbi:hypothetical protein AKJ08_3154 [Vulgatibacter incomptus]|uniref:Uncharacterized protein n=1 Tax=Vulgatibacter incomptus TaxID=1391653 RepID=A0A0K1PGZ1_9BACT|nr:hypothetical protein AKJ08_3154 [Vulgatibacter incomptus]